MLLITPLGHYFTVVEDFEDPDVLWVRSQDKESVQHVIRTLSLRVAIPNEKASYELIDEPTWDYQFRVRLTRPLWKLYLDSVVDELHCHKLKPAVNEARGARHPIARLVEEIFYYMSKHRPDGSRPAWLEGGKRRGRLL